MAYFSHLFRAALLGACLAASTAAQASDAQCILAGRLNGDGLWAPAARGVTLLDAAGQRIRGSSQSDLNAVKAVRLNQNALLASCQGNQPLADGNANPGRKGPAPAVTASPAALNVQAMALVPGRAGGQWVELRLDLPPERVTLLAR